MSESDELDFDHTTLVAHGEAIKHLTGGGLAVMEIRIHQMLSTPEIAIYEPYSALSALRWA